MKSRFLIITLLSLLFINHSFTNTINIRIRGKNYTITVSSGWNRTGIIWPDMITFRRGKEYTGIRLHQVGDDFQKYLTQELYTLKRIERRIESETKVFIEGIEFHQLTSEKIVNQLIQYQMNIIGVRNGISIHFRYFTYDLNTFKRNLDEFKINISRFLRQNFIR